MNVTDDWIEDYLFDITRIVVLASMLAMILLPLLYALSISFRLPREVFGTIRWIPKEPTLDRWLIGFRELSGPLMNSVLISIGTTALTLLLTIPGAYAIARIDLPGKRIIFYLIVFSLLFPYLLLVVPITDMWRTLGLFDTIPGLWIANQIIIAPFAVWILRDFFEKLPPNLEEVAQVYGCTQFQAFRKVILPLALPALVAVGFLAFLAGWKEFLFANMLTTGTGPRPAIVALYGTLGGGAAGSERIEWSLVLAETMIIAVPPVVLYMISRKYLSDALSL